MKSKEDLIHLVTREGGTEPPFLVNITSVKKRKLFMCAL